MIEHMNRRFTRSFRSYGARHEWVKIPVHCAYIYRLIFSPCAIATQDLLLIRQRAVTCWNLNKHEGIQHIHYGYENHHKPSCCKKAIFHFGRQHSHNIHQWVPTSYNIHPRSHNIHQWVPTSYNIHPRF
jgi:hypothetical protein